MIHWGMTTTPHREHGTIERTLKSLVAAGINDVRMFVDDGSFGCKMNFDRALKEVFGGDYIDGYTAILQDDMVACNDALKVIEARLSPDEVLSVFAPLHNVRHCPDQTGWVDLNPGWEGWGNMFVIPDAVVAEVLTHPFYLEHLDNDLDQQHTDACLWEVFRRMGQRVVTHVPSLFDHIGHTSTIGNIHGPETSGHRFNEWK
jgi:hypothetical protein